MTGDKFIHTTKFFVLVLFLLPCFILASCDYPLGVTITEPLTDSTFDEGDSIIFTVTIYDPDGIIEAKWVSSIDGVIKSTEYERKSTKSKMSFSKSDLSPGKHDIYCFAYDEQVLKAEDSISITVGDGSVNQALFALISSPRNSASFAMGKPVVFSAKATDPDDGNLTGSALTWASDKDGEMGTGNDLPVNNLSIGTHSITLKAVNSQLQEKSSSVSISIHEDNSTDDTSTTTSPWFNPTTSTVPDTTTTIDNLNTTTIVSGSTTSTAASSDNTTTTTTFNFDCPPEEPIGCIDPDYSLEQYWCCEEELPKCGKVEYVDGVPQGTCLPDDGSGTSSTVPVSTTTTVDAPPDRTTLYLSPDPESDLLFYVHHADGTKVFYNGFDAGNGMNLTYISFEDGSAIIFNNDFYPVQWILEDVSVAAYVLDDAVPFDPEKAYHEAMGPSGQESFTIDIYPDDLSSVLTEMELNTGEQFNDAASFLSEYSISSFSDLQTRAKQAGSEQARFIAAAVGFSTAASYLSMYEVENTPAKIIKTAAFSPLAPIIKYAVKAAVSLLASKFNEEFGPQPPTDPEDPGVEVQLCRGASSMSQICHYMFFRPSYPGSAGPCIDLCFTNMKCFTDICMPKTLSSQSAEDFRNHFYN